MREKPNVSHAANVAPDRPARIPANFLTIQALRAIAALMVVAFHTFESWSERIDPHAPGADWGNGAAGVDIFFVISGFVMVIAARRLIAQPAAWAEFLRHRIVRIVPLYWLLSTAKLAAVLAMPALALRTRLDPGFIAGSYAFLPVIDHAGNFRPLIPMGWTLTYEFIFYVFFATALALRAQVLRVIVPPLGLIALLALLRAPGWPSWTILFSTIVIEFVFGVLLARLTLAGHRLRAPIAAFALLAGLIAILVVPMISADWRVVTWGIPALAIVAGAVSLERRVATWLPHWLLALGDASYSIYLGHGFLVPVIVLTLGTMAPDGLAIFAAVATCLLGAAVLGRLMYRHVEQPIIRFFRARRGAALAGQPAA